MCIYNLYIKYGVHIKYTIIFSIIRVILLLVIQLLMKILIVLYTTLGMLRYISLKAYSFIWFITFCSSYFSYRCISYNRLYQSCCNKDQGCKNILWWCGKSNMYISGRLGVPNFELNLSPPEILVPVIRNKAMDDFNRFPGNWADL